MMGKGEMGPKNLYARPGKLTRASFLVCKLLRDGVWKEGQ